MDRFLKILKPTLGLLAYGFVENVYVSKDKDVKLPSGFLSRFEKDIDFV